MLNMWYEYEWQLQDNEEIQGHYETENEKEIIKRLLTTFTDVINGECKVKMLEEKIIEGQRYCNLYVKYYHGNVKTAKFGNIPINSTCQIDTLKLNI